MPSETAQQRQGVCDVLNADWGFLRGLEVKQSTRVRPDSAVCWFHYRSPIHSPTNSPTTYPIKNESIIIYSPWLSLADHRLFPVWIFWLATLPELSGSPLSHRSATL